MKNNQDNVKKNSKSIIFKIIIVLVIILLIVGVYFFKKSQDEELLTSTNVENSTNTNQEEVSIMFDEETLDIEKLTSYGVPVIIDFTANYCPSCREFLPILKDLKKQYGDDIIIKVINLDDYPNLANEYNITSIPTQLLFNADGTPCVPSEYMSLNIETVYDDENNHIYTKHFAASSYKKMQVFLYEMGLDNEEDVKEFYEISNKNKQTIEVNK